MMMSEFIDRTGFEPTAKEYAKIEEAYYDFDGEPCDPVPEGTIIEFVPARDTWDF